jgi:hypothetical protein
VNPDLDAHKVKQALSSRKALDKEFILFVMERSFFEVAVKDLLSNDLQRLYSV